MNKYVRLFLLVTCCFGACALAQQPQTHLTGPGDPYYDVYTALDRIRFLSEQLSSLTGKFDPATFEKAPDSKAFLLKDLKEIAKCVLIVKDRIEHVPNDAKTIHVATTKYMEVADKSIISNPVKLNEFIETASNTELLAISRMLYETRPFQKSTVENP